MKDLIVFDFDGTLINTMLPDPGKQIYLEKTGEPWKHRGWWGRKESLDIEIFDHPVNDWVFEQYKKAVEIDAHKIVLTGRLKKLKNEVEAILDFHGIQMDEVHCNWGGRTQDFKLKVLGDYLKNHGSTLERMVMYDDREAHYPHFKKWGVNAQKRTGVKIVMDKIVDGYGFYEL